MDVTHIESGRRRAGLFASALIIALGGIIYELMIGTVSSYLLGDSILQFSLTIGFMLFGMGIGSFIAPRFSLQAESSFVYTECFIALLGGSSPALLFWLFNKNLAFYPLFIGIIIGIGIFIGLEIPLMYAMLKSKEDNTILLSRILSLDYIGALIASLAFPLILLPKLGLLRTAFLVGLLNALIACIVYITFSKQLLRRRFLGGFLILTCLLLSAGAIYSNSISRKLEQGIYKDQIIFSEQSPYQKIVLTRFKNDIRLFLNQNLQFSSLDEYRYHEPLVHIPFLAAPQAKQILVLGGGDGLAVRELLKHSSIEHITLVDLDSHMTDLAKNNPLLKELNAHAFENQKVQVIHADAFSYLRESTTTYDLIIADLPDPNDEGLAKLYSMEFYALIRRRLSSSGVFLTQATSPYASNETFWMIERTVKAAGLQTTPIHAHVPSFGEWGFVMGTPEPFSLPSSTSSIALPSSLRFLRSDILSTLFVFDPDMRAKNSSNQINTLIQPVILTTYGREAREWTE